MLELKSRNKTVFVSSHHLLDAQEYCDEICILREGDILQSGNLVDLLGENQNLEKYFIDQVLTRKDSNE